jgi:hypothetical protein
VLQPAQQHLHLPSAFVCSRSLLSEQSHWATTGTWNCSWDPPQLNYMVHVTGYHQEPLLLTHKDPSILRTANQLHTTHVLLGQASDMLRMQSVGLTAGMSGIAVVISLQSTGR